MKKLSALLLVLLLVLTALVACTGDDPKESSSESESESGSSTTNDALSSARDYLYSMYKDADNTVTGADFSRTAIVSVSGVKYTVEWTVDNDKIKIEPAEDGKTVLVNVDENSATEEAYTLTATVKDADGNTASCTFKHTVPAYKVNTWEEYAAAKNDAPLVVQGIVTAVISKTNENTYNCLYIQDEVGGYYIYGMEADPVELGIKVGMTVEAKGKKDNYNGTLKLKSATVTIVDETIKTPTAVDYTEIYKNAEALTDAALAGKQGLLVTIKGVELQKQSDADISGGYYRFKLGELSSYVRISGSVCPLIKADQTTFKATFAEHVGYTADVTGVICVYNDAFYLTPVSVDAYANFAAIERTDEEKVQFELDNLKLDAKYHADTIIDLILNGATCTDVAIAWTSDNAAAVISEGKLTITIPETETEITVTATATCGEATSTREFKITLSLIEFPETSLKDAIASEDGTKVMISGIVTEIKENDAWSDKYENMSFTIWDGESYLYIHRLGLKVELGDAVTIKGVVSSYKGEKQIAQGATGEITGSYKETGITDAAAAADGTLVILKGTVASIKDAWSDKYGNISVFLKDESGAEILLFKLATKVEVGDVLTVYGAVGSYNGSKQIAAGAVAMITAGAGEGGETESGSESESESATESNTESTTESETTGGTEGGATVEGYTQVTSVAVGDMIVLTYIDAAGSKYVEFGGVDDNNIGIAVDYTGSFAPVKEIEVVAGATEGTVAFKVDGKYLAWKTGIKNKVILSETLDAFSSWVVTADDDGNAVVTNQGDTTRILQYNVAAPRFCCYTGSQQSLTIWKKN